MRRPAEQAGLQRHPRDRDDARLDPDEPGLDEMGGDERADRPPERRIRVVAVEVHGSRQQPDAVAVEQRADEGQQPAGGVAAARERDRRRDERQRGRAEDDGGRWGRHRRRLPPAGRRGQSGTKRALLTRISYKVIHPDTDARPLAAAAALVPDSARARRPRRATAWASRKDVFDRTDGRMHLWPGMLYGDVEEDDRRRGSSPRSIRRAISSPAAAARGSTGSRAAGRRLCAEEAERLARYVGVARARRVIKGRA